MSEQEERSPLQHPPAGMTRRAAVQAGAIGLLGLGMNHVAMLQAAGAKTGSPAPRPRAKSVVYIFLSGGLSQIDSFDMKPDAPREIRGEFDPIPTRTPGLQICEHLPMLARRSHLWGLCRSITHPWNEHSQAHQIMLSGRSELPPGFDPRGPKDSDWPSIATLANHLIEARANLPPAIVLPEKLVHRTGRVIPGQFAGQMGERNDPFLVGCAKYNPTSYGAFPEYTFHHREGAKQQGLEFQTPNLTLPHELGLDRLHGRLELVDHLDAQQAHLERSGEAEEWDRYRAMAVSLLSDPKTKRAFDVSAADPKTLDRYGRNSFGKSLLLARQLVETGVSLVQVNLGNNETWDNHEAIFPNLKDFLFPPTDRRCPRCSTISKRAGSSTTRSSSWRASSAARRRSSPCPVPSSPGATTGAPCRRHSSPEPGCRAAPSSVRATHMAAAQRATPRSLKTSRPRSTRRSVCRSR